VRFRHGKHVGRRDYGTVECITEVCKENAGPAKQMEYDDRENVGKQYGNVKG